MADKVNTPRSVTPQDGVAWITGASSGIGAQLALQLERAGWIVLISARSKDALEVVAAQASGAGQIHPAPLDVADADAVANTVEDIESRHGPIALAVYNAGVYLPVNAEAPDFAAFKTTYAVNILGVAAGLAALNPRMAARRRGQIAIVSSATGFGGMPTASAYGGSKAALINMAECLKLELDRWGVKVQLITPGFVDTPAQDDNTFPKPFMVTAETAAKRIVKGLSRKAFEVTFPRRFTWGLMALYALPSAWRLGVIARQTGWSKPLADDAVPSGS